MNIYILAIEAAAVVVVFFQLIYFLKSFNITINSNEKENELNYNSSAKKEKTSIVIPVFGSETTIAPCMEAILNNSVEWIDKVIIVMDRCDPAVKKIIQGFIEIYGQRNISLQILELHKSRHGKVQSLLVAGQSIKTKTSILLDSDIILAPDAIKSIINYYYTEGKPFASCLIFPYQSDSDSHTFTQKIISNNRLYRQSILQMVKNQNNVANFPGGFQMVDYEAYSKFLTDGFLEDLTATYAVLRSGGRIAILNKVLAYEVEKQTLQGLFLQRVRWSIGSLQHFLTQIYTAGTRKSLVEKILVNSYHVMWEIQYYVIVLTFCTLPFYLSHFPILAAPFSIYVCSIFRSAYLTRNYYNNSLTAILLHCILHPIIIAIALPGSLMYVLKKRRFHFETKALYTKD